MLPIRSVAELLGFEVKWDENTKSAKLIKDKTVVIIPKDSNKILVNDKIYFTDTKSIIRNNRFMLPIGNISRALGLKDDEDIIWKEDTQEIILNI